MTKIFGETKTPFIVTFGNHDEETDMNNAQILDYLCTRPYNLTYDAEKGLSGSGNCMLTIRSSDAASENGYSISSILTIIPKTVLLVIMIGLSMIR